MDDQDGALPVSPAAEVARRREQAGRWNADADVAEEHARAVKANPVAAKLDRPDRHRAFAENRRRQARRLLQSANEIERRGD